jgi:hypothetical protein
MRLAKANIAFDDPNRQGDAARLLELRIGGGGSLTSWVADSTERKQAPPDFAAVATMVVFSSVLGCRIGLRPKPKDDWTVAANLWGMSIGRSGTKKTRGMSDALLLVHRADEITAAEHNKRMKEYEIDCALYKQKRDAAVKKGIRPTDPEPEEPRTAFSAALIARINNTIPKFKPTYIYYIYICLRHTAPHILADWADPSGGFLDSVRSPNRLRPMHL